MLFRLEIFQQSSYALDKQIKTRHKIITKPMPTSRTHAIISDKLLKL